MHALDSRTFLFITALLGPVLALVLLSLRRSYATSVHGLGWWAQGAGWASLGALLLWLREILPNNNLLMLLGVACMPLAAFQWLMGTEKFLGLPSSVPRLKWLAFFGFLCVVWFLLVVPDFQWRYTALGLTMATLHLIHFWRLLQGQKMQLASRVLAFSLLALASTWLLRVAGVLTGHLTPDLFSTVGISTLLLALHTVCFLLCLIGFVLLASERIREEFERLASHDSLTGALMRGAWLTNAQVELDRSRRHMRPLALVAMDLDHFKQINDTLGHAAGDQALIDYVNCVTQHLRAQDSLGRIGGEEFVLLLPETSAHEAHVVAERIRSSIAMRQVEPHYTVSMGIAELTPEDSTVATLLARADAAMYQAKSKGRNRVVLAGGLLTELQPT
jgi:diguanylate cyclase (GGDEF)-like protein